MKMLKKFCFLGINVVASATSFLTACSTSHVDGAIQLSINKYDVVQYTNNLLTNKPKATYPFNLNGQWKNGDVLQISLINQTLNDQPCTLIELSPESYWIEINDQQKNVSVDIKLVDDVINQIYEVKFSLLFNIIRSNSTIYKIQIDNLFFENCTPTYDSMFDITQHDGKTILNGFKDEQWVAESLAKCNTLLIPKNIDCIESGAFVKLTKSTIPSNVQRLILGSPIQELNDNTVLTKIGDQSFANWSGLTYKVVFPQSLQYIGNKAFANCVNLSEDLVFAANGNLSSIGSEAFYNDQNISGQLSLPSSITHLGDKAFYACGFRGTLDLGQTHIQQINSYAFAECKNLTNILINTNQTIIICDHAFYKCSALSDINNLLHHANFIGQQSFGDCQSLTNVVLSSNIIDIADEAFANCDTLSLIDLSSIAQPTDDIWLGKYIFSKGPDIGTIKVVSSSSIQTWQDWFWHEELLEDYKRIEKWSFEPVSEVKQC